MEEISTLYEVIKKVLSTHHFAVKKKVEVKVLCFNKM